jgi:hypothetical protein
MPVALFLILAASHTWSFDVGQAPVVKVSNLGGVIEVEAVRGRAVGVTAEATGGSAEQQESWTVETHQSPAEISVRVCCGACGKRHKKCDDSVQWSLVVKVPSDTSLQLNGVSSHISVKDVLGEQRISSVSGDVEVDGSAAPLSVSTVSGKIAVRPRAPKASQIHSVSGDVSVALPAGAEARVSLSTVSGRLNGERRARSLGRTGPRMAIDTVSGDVTVAEGAGGTPAR